MLVRLTVAILALATLAPPAAQAKSIGEKPVLVFGESGVQMPADGVYRVECRADEEPMRSIFSAETFDHANGMSRHWHGSRNGTGFPVFARLGDDVLDVVPPDEDGIAVGFSLEVRVFVPGLLRYGLAIWGGDPQCSLSINDAPRALPLLPVTNAVRLDDRTFPSVAGATAGFANVTLNGLYERDSHGFLFAFLTTEFGAASARGSDGQGESSAGDLPWVSVATPSNARWTYELPVSIDLFLGPNLWILDLPS